MALATAQLEDAYRTYGYLVLRRCRAVLRDEDLAKDALQETFMRVMRYGDALAQADAPLRWLYRVSDRVCFDALDRGRKAPSRPGDDDDPPAVPDLARLPDRAAADRDLVLRFLHKLDDPMRTLTVLYFVEGLSQDEIASELGWSRQRVNRKVGWLKDRARALRPRFA